MTVPAPDQTVWWDAAAVAGDVLARLRLQSGDVDAERITGLVDVAGEMINDYLDLCDERPVTPVRANAIRSLTVELYGRRDIPIIGVGGNRTVEQVLTDPDLTRIGEILASLGPKKERWGIA